MTIATPLETAETVLREHRRSTVATPDDAVDEFCSRCYLWDEPWPCAAVVLATALLDGRPQITGGGAPKVNEYGPELVARAGRR